MRSRSAAIDRVAGSTCSDGTLEHGLIVIEVKTEIHNLGQIVRMPRLVRARGRAFADTLGDGGRDSVVGCLLLLSTEANDVRVAANRAAIASGFPSAPAS